MTAEALAGGQVLNSPREKTVADELGFQWDVDLPYGFIDDGSNNCFDGAMLLQLNGSNVPFSATAQKITADDQYILQGAVNELRVHRLVSLDRKRGAARYIDVFTNTGKQAVTVPVQLRISLSGSAAQVMTSRGQAFQSGPLGKGEIGFAAIRPASDQRPGVLLLVGDDQGAVRPVIDEVSRQIFNVRYQLPLEPGQTRALVYLIAQRRSEQLTAEAMPEQFAPFYMNGLIDADVPEILSARIANFGAVRDFGSSGSFFTILQRLSARVGVFDRQGAVLVLGEDVRLAGQLNAGRFTVQTRFGPCEVEAAEVAAMVGGNDEGRPQRLVLRSGEILAGPVHSDDAQFKLTSGGVIALHPAKLDVLLTKPMQGDGQPPEQAATFVRMYDGNGVMLSANQTSTLPLATAWGRLDVPIGEILHMERSDDERVPGYRVQLADGSRVNPFPLGQPVHLDSLRLGEIELDSASIAAVHRVTAPTAPTAGASGANDAGAAVINLYGGSVVVGTPNLTNILALMQPHDQAAIQVEDVKHLRLTSATRSARGVKCEVQTRDGKQLRKFINAPFVPVKTAYGMLRVPATYITEIDPKPRGQNTAVEIDTGE